MGGTSLPVSCRRKSGGLGSSKSVIMVFLAGGPSHMDTRHEEDAPAEIRGEFASIPTKADGIRTRIPPALPNRWTSSSFAPLPILLTPNLPLHDGGLSVARNGWWLAFHRLGSVQGQGWQDGYAGHVIWAEELREADSSDPLTPASRPTARGVTWPSSRLLQRYAFRKGLLASFDGFRRDADASGMMKGFDAFNQQADIITSERLAKALDLKKEDAKTVERYGNDCRSFLLARRVVEAGARFVTLTTGGWDSHRDNFKNLRAKNLPNLDKGVSNLLQDLRDRSMLDA